MLVPDGRIGRRLHGIDLAQPLTPDQASALLRLLDEHRVITFPHQNSSGFNVHDLERLANHFGAPITHPSNYANYGATDEPIRLKAPDDQRATKANRAFPGQIVCSPGAESAAVYVITNLVDSGPDAEVNLAGGQHWHTDIEFEPAPLNTSLFFVDRVPTPRERGNGTWVTNPPREEWFYHPDSAPELARLREALPLNGETAYTDTAAALAALPVSEQRALGDVMIRRRFRKSDPGFVVPLVHTNPRSGTKSLHSPVWASRGKRVAPAQVEGMSDDESRAFLDRLEAHCLRPEFRYDHVHAPGDVTIWDNYATLHTAPPSLSVINDIADARLLYRVSTKGEPATTLPRTDSQEWIDSNIVPPYQTPMT